MSVQTNLFNVSEPAYYHREYVHDIGEPSNDHSWFDGCKRVGTVALPFVSLYKPLSFPLSLAMGGVRTVHSIFCLTSAIQKGGSGEIGYELLQTIISIIALAGTIFAHPLGMLITTGHDLIVELTHLVQNLYVGEYQKSLEHCLSLVNNALYLVLFLDGGLELAIASLVMQILIGLYHSINEFQNGKWMEGAGHVLMAMVRGNQLTGQVKILQLKWEIEKVARTPAIANGSLNTSFSVDTVSHKKENKKIAFSQMLSDAQKTENQELIDILIKYGDNPENIPPLLCAVKCGDLNAVKLLVASGVNINEITQSESRSRPKECALTAAFCHPKILQFLIDSGADVDIKLAQRQTPLHYAVQSQDSEALSILLKGGADVHAKDLYGRTPLHVGIYDKKIALELLDRGADLHAVDDEGWKPLHRAYHAANIDVLKELVKRGASLNEFTPQGCNALHCAARRDLNLLKWLIDEQKMDVNAWSKWHDGVDGAPTVFMGAVENQRRLDENFEILEFLLSRGADINAKIHYGNRPPHCGTILDWAKDFGRCPRYVLDWLIQHGARSER